ncbi:MAG: hypothetical protein ACREIC_09920 [Limisphaerales bacterium]
MTKDKTEKTKPMSEAADSATRNYEHAVRTGLKFQEEASRWWSSMLNQTSGTQDWQRRLNNLSGMTNSLVPMAQQRMEDMLAFIEKNNRTGTELMKRAVDAAQTPVLAESQAKWMEFWTSSMGAVRSNNEAMSEISNKAIDSWIEFVRNNSDITESRAPKTS